MAEEFHERLSSFNLLSSLRCTDIFSRPTTVNSGDIEESFGCSPSTTDLFELNKADSFDNFSAHPSSLDWSQSFFESSETETEIQIFPTVKNSPVSSATTKSNRTGSRDSILPIAKKIRIETPSPLPTFKVRKEKLGDRITALQQLVSPFGKTDTASVLHEAIEYIKFLHEQVNALSNPYLTNGLQSKNQKILDKRTKKDLRSLGLCLVPISSTFTVATNELPQIDFWTQLSSVENYYYF